MTMRQLRHKEIPRQMSNKVFSVEISENVMERINRSVSSSSVEIGGKLLGNVRTGLGRTTFKVHSFLDAGPKVSQSVSHIIPDGEYQEALFRVIESLDPTIEHIGSWHSHHCNGLSQLSGGDVRGYMQNVNDTRYNCDVFLVLLITGFSTGRLSCKYWVFTRGQRDYVEIPSGQVRILRETYRFEILLSTAEECVMRAQSASSTTTEAATYRPVQNVGAHSGLSMNYEPNARSGAIQSKSDKKAELLTFRAEDNRWIQHQFHGVRSFAKKNSGTVSWRWEEYVAGQQLSLKYEHPSANAISPVATLEVRLGSKCILNREIPLDAARLDKLAEAVKNVRHITEKRKETQPNSNSNNGSRLRAEDA